MYNKLYNIYNKVNYNRLTILIITKNTYIY